MKTSESIAKISLALLAFHKKAEGLSIKRDGTNSFIKDKNGKAHKYATIDNIISSIESILNEVGIVVLQFPGGDGETITMKTILMHESGEYIESDELKMKPVKNDPQGIGSAITYARRYQLGAILNLATEEDDDANAATGRTGGQTEQKQAQKQTERKANGSQARQLRPTNEVKKDLGAFAELAEKNKEEQRPAPAPAQKKRPMNKNERGYFFKLASDRKLSEAHQKLIVFGFTGKTSRGDVTNEEFYAINTFLESATMAKINQVITEAKEAAKNQEGAEKQKAS